MNDVYSRRAVMQNERKTYIFLAVSDSHNDKDTLERIIKKEADADLIIHLGDGIEKFEDLMIGLRKINVSVKGNSDNDNIAQPVTKTITFFGKKLFLAHGHTFDVKTTYDKIIEKAWSENADLCLFGHMHQQYINVVNGMTILNPGAVSCFHEYAVIKITDGVIRAELKCLKNND